MSGWCRSGFCNVVSCIHTTRTKLGNSFLVSLKIAGSVQVRSQWDISKNRSWPIALKSPGRVSFVAEIRM